MEKGGSAEKVKSQKKNMRSIDLLFSEDVLLRPAINLDED